MESEAAAFTATDGPKRRYTYPEAAAILRTKERWLRENIKKLPHSKKGVTVTFSEVDLDTIDAMFHHQPPSLVRPSRINSVGAHPLADLKPLGARRRQK